MERDELLSKLKCIEGRQVNVFVGNIVTIGRLRRLDRDGRYAIGERGSTILASDVETVRINTREGYIQINARDIYSNGRDKR